MANRFRFVKDNDGHNYLIPADLQEEFYKFVDAEDEEQRWDGRNFDECRIDGISRWTFENPQDDE